MSMIKLEQKEIAYTSCGVLAVVPRGGGGANNLWERGAITTMCKRKGHEACLFNWHARKRGEGGIEG